VDARDCAEPCEVSHGADRRLIRFPTREATLNQEYKDSEDERLKKRYRINIPPPQFDVTIRLCGLSNIDYTDPSVITDAHAFRCTVIEGA
jgi:hypothetical protein